MRSREEENFERHAGYPPFDDLPPPDEPEEDEDEEDQIAH